MADGSSSGGVGGYGHALIEAKKMGMLADSSSLGGITDMPIATG